MSNVRFARAASGPRRPTSDAIAQAMRLFGEVSLITDDDHLQISHAEQIAAQIQAEARREAEQLLAAARADADAQLKAARAEANKLRRSAAEDGRAAGLEKAAQQIEERIADGILVGVSENVARETATMRGDVQAFCAAVVAEQQRAWQSLEAELAALGCQIAEKIVRAELQTNPEVVVEITRHALRRLEGYDRVRIRVNPDDVERLRARRDDLLQLLEGLQHIEITDDRRVDVGGVQIETNSGTLDARIGAQITEISRALDC